MAIPVNIEDLIKQKVVESTRIEYKESFNPEPIVRTICAFANDIDNIMVVNGPGSFTGVRIGVCACKGLAMASKKNCIRVSTLLSLAYNLIDFNCIACAAMDARRNQVYNAIFKICDGKIEKLCKDRAISLDELGFELKNNYKK